MLSTFSGVESKVYNHKDPAQLLNQPYSGLVYVFIFYPL